MQQPNYLKIAPHFWSGWRTIPGVDWQRYILLGSTNLTTWYTNTAAITMADGVHYYTNTLGTTNNPFSHQFFKAILVP